MYKIKLNTNVNFQFIKNNIIQYKCNIQIVYMFALVQYNYFNKHS